MRNTTDIVTGLLTIGVSALGAWGVVLTGEPSEASVVEPTTFTKAIVTCLFILGCVQTWMGLTAKRKISYWPSRTVIKKIAYTVVLFFCYACLTVGLSNLLKNTGVLWLSDNVAFWIATFMFLVTALLVGGRRKPLEILLVAALVPSVIVFTFSKFFLITLP